jgi:hypothetical protein
MGSFNNFRPNIPRIDVFGFLSTLPYFPLTVPLGSLTITFNGSNNIWSIFLPHGPQQVQFVEKGNAQITYNPFTGTYTFANPGIYGWTLYGDINLGVPWVTNEATFGFNLVPSGGFITPISTSTHTRNPGAGGPNAPDNASWTDYFVFACTAPMQTVTLNVTANSNTAPGTTGVATGISSILKLN